MTTVKFQLQVRLFHTFLFTWIRNTDTAQITWMAFCSQVWEEHFVPCALVLSNSHSTFTNMSHQSIRCSISVVHRLTPEPRKIKAATKEQLIVPKVRCLLWDVLTELYLWIPETWQRKFHISCVIFLIP